MATKTTRTDTTETSVTEAIREKGAKGRGPSINRVSLIGRIATDPVLRYTPNGVVVTNFRLANNGTYEVQSHRSSRGEDSLRSRPSTSPRVVWSTFSGRLGSRIWTGQDGGERYELEIAATDIQFLSAKAAGYPPAAVAA